MSNSFPELEDLKKIELEILIDFDELCKKHNLSYFLDSGTALGAKRHSGFIPWDDDIDVGMLRDDYERFLRVAQEEFGDKYFVQNRSTDKVCPITFTKIRKNNTLFLEWNKRNLNMHHGIFIDVFPFDQVPEESELQLEYIVKCKRLSSKVVRKYTKFRASRSDGSIKWMIGNIVYKLQHLFLQLVSRESLDNKVNKEFIKYNDLQRERELFTSHSYSKVVIFTKEELFPTRTMDFEGYLFPVPNKIEVYLEKIYGDYMQLPPEEARVGHRPYKISLDSDK